MDRQAHSISRRVWQWVKREPFAARVLAVFDRACSLVTSEGDVATLVLPQIAAGPLNIVVDGQPGDFGVVRPGTPVQSIGSRLLVGEMAVSLDGASVWEPRPDWERLRLHQEIIMQQLGTLEKIALSRDPGGSLLALLNMAHSTPAGLPAIRSGTRGATGGDPTEPARRELASTFLISAQAGAEAVRLGWWNDAASLQEGAEQLAGLGTGLTPAGDDFLTGFMLWAWLAHPTPRHFCEEIIRAAILQTGLLSAAFLRAAAEGECSTAWHQLLDAALKGKENQLAKAVGDVLSHGHTSGADTLSGFLWIAQPHLARQ